MTHCLFVSDLHGSLERYRKLILMIQDVRPEGVFLGGDLLPHGMAAWRQDGTPGDFVRDFLLPSFRELRNEMTDAWPQIFVILGNDDPRAEEPAIVHGESEGLWVYAHGRSCALGTHQVYGYSFVPPTPFQLKDWERYDVSRFVDPGCVSPEEGAHSVEVAPGEARYSTIEKDLESLAGEEPMERAILMFHSPPSRTKLDRAALDGKMIDHVPLDVHVGSIAIRRFIQCRQPLVTLHGHVHESVRLTGSWSDRIGRTHMFSAAHDGPELAVVQFDPQHLQDASRTLV